MPTPCEAGTGGEAASRSDASKLQCGMRFWLIRVIAARVASAIKTREIHECIRERFAVRIPSAPPPTKLLILHDNTAFGTTISSDISEVCRRGETDGSRGDQFGRFSVAFRPRILYRRFSWCGGLSASFRLCGRPGGLSRRIRGAEISGSTGRGAGSASSGTARPRRRRRRAGKIGREAQNGSATRGAERFPGVRNWRFRRVPLGEQPGSGLRRRRLLREIRAQPVAPTIQAAAAYRP